MACGGDDDDDGDGGGPPDPPQTFMCTASITPVEFDYLVTGETLEIMTTAGSDFLQRVAAGAPGLPVYGTWHVGTQTTPGVGTVSLDLLVEPAEVSAIADCDFGTVSATAHATSAAEVTAISIAILEADQDVQVVTR